LPDHGGVEEAVAVEVSHCHGLTIGIDEIGLWVLEVAIPLAEQDTDHVRIEDGYDQIRDTVAVQVAHRHTEGLARNGSSPRRLERAVSLAQQNSHDARRASPTGHAAGTCAGHGKVQDAVAVEIANGHCGNGCTE